MLYRLGVAILLTLAMLLPANVYAETKPHGLNVQPSKWELKVSAGKVTDTSYIVANYTKEPLTVYFTVKQFSATDFAYNYKFTDPTDKWITFSQPKMVLQPDEKVRVNFAIDVPKNAVPGGHYFALFATADMLDAGIKQTGQVVSTLYVTVDGKLQQSGEITNGRVPFLVMGDEIEYKFDARNTGNVHYSASLFGKLEGLFGGSTQKGTSHVLMPNAARTIGGTVQTPLLPGLYKFTYGYKADDKTETSKTTYVLYLPPWFIVAVLFAAYVGFKLWKKKMR